MPKMIHTLYLVVAFVGLSGVATSAQTELAGVRFDDKVSIDDNGMAHELTLSGTALRKKLVFKVYAMGHYMDAASFDSEDEAYAAALGNAGPKMIRMVFKRGVDSGKIQNAYREGFEKNASPEEFEAITAQIDQFVGYYNEDVAEGDEYLLTYVPGGTVRIAIRGEQVGTIESETFASVLWRIWLGEHSIVDRDKLVARMVSE